MVFHISLTSALPWRWPRCGRISTGALAMKSTSSLQRASAPSVSPEHFEKIQHALPVKILDHVVLRRC
jgi:hypothetical protein